MRRSRRISEASNLNGFGRCCSPRSSVWTSGLGVVLQSRYSLGSPPRMYLLRAVVDTDRFPLEVVTVYRTSRVDRYWRSDS